MDARQHAQQSQAILELGMDLALAFKFVETVLLEQEKNEMMAIWQMEMDAVLDVSLKVDTFVQILILLFALKFEEMG